MSAGDDGGARGLDQWVTLSGDGGRPPVLVPMFWGTFVAHAVFGLYTVVAEPESRLAGVDASGPLELMEAGHLLAFILTGVLWPFLNWSVRPVGRRPVVLSLAFFASAFLMVLTSGGTTVFILACLGLANVTLVLGPRVAVACAVLFCPAPIVLFVARGDWMKGVLEASLFLCLNVAVILVFRGLIAARERARHTRHLLVDLEEAHAELRRYAERTRELSVAEERARMAREMHDSVGHYLTVINMGLANAERFRRARPDQAWEEVADAKRLTQEALADTRRWVRALRPLSLEGRAGPEAMQALASAFSGSGMDVAFSTSGEWPGLGEEAELVCYRVVQEGLTNAARHSAASRVSVSVECVPDRVTVTIADDGRGAPEEATEEGWGISALGERLAAVGGALTTGNRDEGGFFLRAELPTPHDTAHPAPLITSPARA
ncbi:sensor histidine kinase [Spiractinospora alimapuensis]|uniref:sensor histidine kinase n=1 Tax=Spiractinospora alimapuensis TaxID=2820884 RepID=UPI001F3D5EB3|nr:sensor histidine kinase [Spiractinospora alimapuensis]QVQ51561.1 sensor histidine kinase [Spiractinospora alimapuensis]